ncbi:hypothetical protein ACIA5G_39105 [Amycolatopsis sp. NPDC051758]|uniref:hypothetical protein n=1 Tax=Amycolatopsis sp. NPDC051758 TaxID=3363935 RepID=UPI0037B160BC
MMQLLKVEDRVLFDGVEHQVVALAGTWVRLAAADGTPSVVLLGHLLAPPGFAILGAAARRRWAGTCSTTCPPRSARGPEREHHVVEVKSGLPPGAAPGTAPRSEFDPALRTVRQREAAKAVELNAAGTTTRALEGLLIVRS